MSRSKIFCLAVLSAALVLASSGSALAQANGEPNLDPSNNTTGTVYDFFVQGSSKPLDPTAGRGATGRLNGTMTIFQVSGAGEFDADILIDTDGNGTETGTMACDGFVGSGRVGMSCSGLNEDGDNIFVMILSKATSKQGIVSMTAGKGLGFTDKSALTFVFQALQQ